MFHWTTGLVVCLLVASQGDATARGPLDATKERLLDATARWPQNATDRIPLDAALSRILDALLDVVAPVSPALGDSPCRRQSLLYRQAVREARPWALRMLDAGTKIPSGVLLRNLVQLGDFDECLRVRHEEPEVGVVEGQHCQVSVGVDDAMGALSIVEKAVRGGLHVSHFHRFDAVLEREGLLAALRLVGGQWAVCVPAACSAAELQLHLRSALPSVPLRVTAHACTARTESVSAWDWQAAVAIVLLSVLVVLLVVGTAYDLANADATGARRPHPILAFSLLSNGRHLFATAAPLGDALSSLHGLRCLATLAVVFSHHCLFVATTAHTNVAELVVHAEDWVNLPVANASLYVDTFLVMSGTLLAFNYLAQRDRRAAFSLSRFYLNRYFRIAPAHAVTVLLGVASGPILHWLGNGPLLKANVAPFVANCSNARWLGLLYIGNYFEQEFYCQSISWYLSIEMQLLFLAPLVLYPLWRRPRLGMALLGLLSAVGIGLVFSVAYERGLRVVSLFQENLTRGNLQQVYSLTHARFVPWLVGLAVGALLSRGVSPSRRQAALGWSACAALGYYSVVRAHAIFRQDIVLDRLHSAIYFALMRPAWALACAWLIFACETGFGGFLKTFLGWRGWQMFSRLSYGVFLTHFALVASLPPLQKTARHLSGASVIIEFWGVVVLSLFAAVALHLAVEMPFYILYHAYQTKGDSEKRLKKDS